MQQQITEFIGPYLKLMLENSAGTEMTQSIISTTSTFIFIASELTVLFLLVSFIIGIILEFLPAEKIQRILGSKGGKGYVSAGLLGALTPFCSCSTIPMLTGLLKARAGFGPTMTFLFTSPLMNPIIMGLLLATFGMKIAITYFAIALIVSVSAGYVLEKMGFERYVRHEVIHGKTAANCCDTKPKVNAQPSCCDTQPVASHCTANNTNRNTNSKTQWRRILGETWKQFTHIFPILMFGVAIGAFTYGFIPTDFITQYAGQDNPLAIPLAAIIGVPLYIRAEAVIPLAAALAAKAWEQER